MTRRDFITLVGGTAVAWPLAARAQQPGRMRRIGVLIGGYRYSAPLAKFREELQKRGWTEQNLQVDVQFATDINQMNSSLTELVGRVPDVLFTNTTSAVLMMREKAKTTPVVFVIVTDPLGSGLVSNLARPGGQVTGFTNFEFSTSGKWFELLREIAPGLARVAVVFNPKTAPYANGYLRPLHAPAASFGVELIASGMADGTEIERVVSDISRRPGSGLMTIPDFFTAVHEELIITLAIRYRIPAVYHYRYFAAAGGLMSYGIDVAEQFQQGALYIDRILRGEKPGDLPVQAPTKYELVINLKTAKALGLDVPATLLARADEVIE
jgi:putative ABC transport system substrate-binding protein